MDNDEYIIKYNYYVKSRVRTLIISSTIEKYIGMLFYTVSMVVIIWLVVSCMESTMCSMKTKSEISKFNVVNVFKAMEDYVDGMGSRYISNSR